MFGVNSERYREILGVAEGSREDKESWSNFLRYLWIQTLNDNPQNVIYVPTEAGLPILEAGKRQ